MRETNPAMMEKRIHKLEQSGGGDIGHLEEAIESIDNSLIANVDGVDKHFYLDYKNGKLGCNTDEERGEDTFIPFNGGGGFSYAIKTDSKDGYTASLKVMTSDGNERIIHYNKTDEFIDNDDIHLYYSGKWKLDIKKDFIYYPIGSSFEWSFATDNTFVLV